MRTGVSSVAAGLALAKLLPHVEPAWVVRLVGAVTTVAGALAMAVGYCGFRHGRRHWQGGLPRAVPMWSVTLLTALLIVSAALALCLTVIE